MESTGGCCGFGDVANKIALLKGLGEAAVGFRSLLEFLVWGHL